MSFMKINVNWVWKLGFLNINIENKESQYVIFEPLNRNMRKIIFSSVLFLGVAGYSQNINYLNNASVGNQAIQAQNVQVFASNVSVNANKVNRVVSPNPVRANSNPQVQQLLNTATNQRRQVRRRTTVSNAGITNAVQTNPVQTNIGNVFESNTDEVQSQVILEQVSNDNLGNAFGNENNGIEQIASANIPAIQLGSGTLNLNLDMNLPSLKLPSVKLSSRKSVSRTSHRTFHLRNKLAKMNRKLTGKLSFGKKLKIKVDNCFKW